MTNKLNNPFKITELINAVNSLVDGECGANQDLSNLTLQGQNIANWSTNVTNCITEIPQDIKLELNDGTLTLKAGSKVYVPNGVGVFDVATISSDRTYTYTSENSTRLLMYKQDQYYLYSAQIGNCYSGSSAPTNTSTTAYWYDTTNNLIKKTTNGGSTWTANTGTLPLAVISVSGGQIISIDQVFNGFGYIGSTAFVLPGVKGLAPNGRNDDGTLKNVNIKFTQVSMTTDTSGATGGLWYAIANNSITRINYGTLTYDTKRNYIYLTSSGSIQHTIIIDFNAYRTSGKITSFNPKTAFHIVDYNDFSDLKNTVDINDSNAVHKTGDETISGDKTFQTDILYKKSTQDFTTTPAQPFYTEIRNVDINNFEIGQFRVWKDTDGANVIDLLGRYQDNSVNFYGATLGIKSYSDGRSVAYAPTPSAGDNSDQIATTRWVNSTGNNVVHKTGDENISGIKTFNHPIHFKSSVFVDAAGGDEGGEIEFAKAPNSSLTGSVKLDVYRNSMRIFGPASNGDIRNVMNADIEQNALFVPTSDKTSSAISTIGINKNQNGYVKFGNGIIIQWGYSNQYGTSKTVTLPTPFTSINYAVTTSRYASEWAEGVVMQTNNYKTTSFDFAANDPGVHWIAVGY